MTATGRPRSMWRRRKPTWICQWGLDTIRMSAESTCSITLHPHLLGRCHDDKETGTWENCVTSGQIPTVAFSRLGTVVTECWGRDYVHRDALAQLICPHFQVPSWLSAAATLIDSGSEDYGFWHNLYPISDISLSWNSRERERERGGGGGGRERQTERERGGGAGRQTDRRWGRQATKQTNGRTDKQTKGLWQRQFRGCRGFAHVEWSLHRETYQW